MVVCIIYRKADLRIRFSRFCVLNRRLAVDSARVMPEDPSATGSLASALEKLNGLANIEREKSVAQTWSCILPHLGADASQLSGLISLSEQLTDISDLTPGAGSAAEG